MLDWMSGKKKPPKCKYPDCGKPATTHWALVDLCDEHRKVIAKETYQYYRGQFTYEERTRYHYISHLIPWAKPPRRRGESDEAICGDRPEHKDRVRGAG
jgi:hypothetical protein